MNDQTPRTEAGRRFIERHGTGKTLEVIAIEAEAAAQARAEGPDVEVLRKAIKNLWPRQGHKAESLACEYRAIRLLAARRDEG